MSQQKKQEWLHLYRIVKSDIDKYLSEHPKSLHNVLNMKKMLHASAFQKVMQEITDRGHPTIQTQLIGPMTSRKTLLIRLRNWFRESFHFSRAPIIRPSIEFQNEAMQHFQDPKHKYDVFYGSLYVTITQRQYHFFVFKTTVVHSQLQGYLPNTIYLMIIVDDETMEAHPLP